MANSADSDQLSSSEDLELDCLQRQVISRFSRTRVNNLYALSRAVFFVQSTLIISKSKGLSEILRDIRISTYQICRIVEKR